MKCHQSLPFVCAIVFLSMAVARADSQFMKKMEALSCVLEWMQEKGGGRPPTPSEISGENFPFTYKRLTGTYDYASRLAHHAIFASPEEYWFALREFGRSQGVPVSLLQAFVRDPSEVFQHEVRLEALDLVLDWIQRVGRLPYTRDFGARQGLIPIRYDRLTALAAYAKGKASQARALFDGAEEFWLALKRRAVERNMPLRLLDVSFSETVKPQLYRALQEEVHELVGEWIHQHAGALPERADFGPKPRQVPVPHARLTGGDGTSPYALFASRQDFWRRQKAYLQERGVSIRLLNLFFKNSLEEETRVILQQEALDLVLGWIRAHGYRLPRVRHFGTEPGQIPIRYHRLVGTGIYQEGGANHGFEIFSSSAEFWQRLIAFAAEQGDILPESTPREMKPRVAKLTEKRPRRAKNSEKLKTRLPKREAVNAPSRVPIKIAARRNALKEMDVPEERRKRQGEALEVIAQWMETSDMSDGRVPRWLAFEDFGGTIPLSYNRLTGVGDYSPEGPLHHERLFDSFKTYKHALESRLGPLDAKNECDAFF